MTLQDTVLFPHAVMPLYIFETRYRKMLADILTSHRLFAIFNEQADQAGEGHEEPPEKIGTVGIVRAAHQNPDGTSNLALQGLVRVRLLEIIEETPYRKIRIETCRSLDEEVDDPYGARRKHILSLLDDQPELSRGLPKEYLQFLHSLTQPAPFIDVAIHSLCHCPKVKQRLLETLSLRDRFALFELFLKKEQLRFDLYLKLQGETREDEIDLN